MKKILKAVFTILFAIGSVFAIHKLIINYSVGSLLCISLAFTMFILHLFAWVAPKIFFNLCWKITNFLPDSFDYDTSYSYFEKNNIGMVITSIIFLVISFLL